MVSGGFSETLALGCLAMVPLLYRKHREYFSEFRRSLLHTHTHSHTHTLTHTLSHTHIHSHTHTLTHILSLSLSHTQYFTCTLLTHATLNILLLNPLHTHTLTHTHTHTHSHTHGTLHIRLLNPKRLESTFFRILFCLPKIILITSR